MKGWAIGWVRAKDMRAGVAWGQAGGAELLGGRAEVPGWAPVRKCGVTGCLVGAWGVGRVMGLGHWGWGWAGECGVSWALFVN